MPLILRLYRLLHSRKLKKLAIFRKLYDIVYQFVDGKYYQMPYFEGKILAIPTYVMGKNVFSVGVYEPEITTFIRSYIKSGFSLIDIGANIGLHTLASAFCKKFDHQKFFAFEPEINTFGVLENNCEINKLNFVIVENMGVGDIQCSMQINVSTTNNQGIHSFLERNGTTPGNEVHITTLDNYFSKLNLFNNIVLKIDVEGYEIPVLMGGIKWLKKCNNAVIVCEICIDSNNFLSEFSTLISNLNDIGFGFPYVFKDSTITEEGLIKSNTFNFLFIKGEKAKEIFHTSPNKYFVNFDEFKEINLRKGNI